MIHMIHGIAIAGANGSDKTTLGKHLAKLLGFKHMDVENYYFKDSVIPYANPHTKEEVQKLLLADIKRNGRFILSAVNCDFGKDINTLYDCVIYIKAPLEIRLHRIKQRSIDKFGCRVYKGGDLYEQEQAFYNFVASRSMKKTDAWMQSVKCPVIYVDGTKPVTDTAKAIKENIPKFMNI